ncbi:hypothetical protein [Actinomadura sp. 6N118]|uniref:hypothetical protein n=1 Tax=Actinomadura sp. 6N118 TaxID=3375151 RepID=UPI0037A2271C
MQVSTPPLTVGAQTIQITATPSKVVWNLGEKALECLGAGSKDSDFCSYTYKRSSAGQPGGAYQLSATISWDVAWTCNGADCDAGGGTLDPLELTSVPEPLVVGEIQTRSRQ